MTAMGFSETATQLAQQTIQIDALRVAMRDDINTNSHNIAINAQAMTQLNLQLIQIADALKTLTQRVKALEDKSNATVSAGVKV